MIDRKQINMFCNFVALDNLIQIWIAKNLEFIWIYFVALNDLIRTPFCTCKYIWWNYLHFSYKCSSHVWLLFLGGHTAEMLHIVEALNLQRYAPRHYIAGSNDDLSLPKAKIFESHLLKDFEFLNQVSKNLLHFYQVYSNLEALLTLSPSLLQFW